MNQLNFFAEKSVLVIGGTSGIGLDAARLFVQSGSTVVIVGYDAEEGRKAVLDLNALGGNHVLFIQADVTCGDQMDRMMSEAVAHVGRIHVAINNAGVEGRFAPLHEFSESEFDRLIAVNLKGVWLGMRLQIPHMLAHGGGCIVNTASSAGVSLIAYEAAYSASKHAVIGLTKAAALEQASAGLRINALAPGPVRTQLLDRMIEGKVHIDDIAAMVPMGRVSEAMELAKSLKWLCSDEASFVTGHTLLADGGLTVR